MFKILTVKELLHRQKVEIEMLEATLAKRLSNISASNVRSSRLLRKLMDWNASIGYNLTTVIFNILRVLKSWVDSMQFNIGSCLNKKLNRIIQNGHEKTDPLLKEYKEVLDLIKKNNV